MRQWQNKIYRSLRQVLGLWLILNVGIATIPRCDSILELLRHSMLDQYLSTDSHQHCQIEEDGGHAAGLSNDKVCACSLIKFNFVQLNQLDIRPVILQASRLLTLIQYPYALGAREINLHPPVPPPRSIPV